MMNLIANHDIRGCIEGCGILHIDCFLLDNGVYLILAAYFVVYFEFIFKYIFI